MANRTVKDAVSIKGTNPQYLIEKIIRTRIYDCRFWKEDCFALTGKILLVLFCFKFECYNFNLKLKIKS
jgi:pre-mRNA-splicing factor 38A